MPLDEPLYLAVLNLTPDSFSDGGLFLDPAQAAAHAIQLLAQGANIVDIGAESTRPGSQPIGPQEEWRRIEPALSLLKKTAPDCILSIDTRHPEVAHQALNQGVDIINDITGFQNAEMLDLASGSNCGLIATRGRMTDGRLLAPDYSDLSPRSADEAVSEIGLIRDRLLSADIDPERIVLDPGFGFGTTFLEDQAIWNALPHLPSLLNWPIERFCIGISRKRFVACTFEISGNIPLDAKTAEMHKHAMEIGYKIFRTHAVWQFKF